MTAFNSLKHRLLTVPVSWVNYNKELLIIKTITINSDCDPPILGRLINEKQKLKIIELLWKLFFLNFVKNVMQIKQQNG